MPSRDSPAGYFSGEFRSWSDKMAVHLPCTSPGMSPAHHDRRHPGGGRGFGEAAALLSPQDPEATCAGATGTWQPRPAPFNPFRPAETLSIQIWNLQVNGQDKALANTASAVPYDPGSGIQHRCECGSHHLKKKSSGEAA